MPVWRQMVERNTAEGKYNVWRIKADIGSGSGVESETKDRVDQSNIADLKLCTAEDVYQPNMKCAPSGDEQRDATCK